MIFDKNFYFFSEIITQDKKIKAFPAWGENRNLLTHNWLVFSVKLFYHHSSTSRKDESKPRISRILSDELGFLGMAQFSTNSDYNLESRLIILWPRRLKN